VTPTRTLWEEGRESGREVVALGFALALTVVIVDVAIGVRVGLLFDLFFVALCIALALAVRPDDFFVVGVLPPLLMGGLFVLLGITKPAALAQPDDGMVQATISGLSHHSAALMIGYALCLGVLFIRQRVAAIREAEAERAQLTRGR
jgi:hypothetical protein